MKLENNFTCVLYKIKLISLERLGQLFDFGQNASEIIPLFHEYTGRLAIVIMITFIRRGFLVVFFCFCLLYWYPKL